MKYPTTNGKQWDAIRKKKFDYLREVFLEDLNNTPCAVDKLTEKELKTVAWNMAFRVVTE